MSSATKGLGFAVLLLGLATCFTTNATDWCTADPLPASGTTAQAQRELDVARRIGVWGDTIPRETIYYIFTEPKRVWCFARNQGEPVFNQCRLTLSSPHAPCVDGYYLNINAASAPPVHWWINFSNAHTDKVREVYVVSEP
ncbi:hypothetical protein GCM10028796_37200 [Ramlibacter monticola]